MPAFEVYTPLYFVLPQYPCTYSMCERAAAVVNLSLYTSVYCHLLQYDLAPSAQPRAFGKDFEASLVLDTFLVVLVGTQRGPRKKTLPPSLLGRSSVACCVCGAGSFTSTVGGGLGCVWLFFCWRKWQVVVLAGSLVLAQFSITVR